MVFLGPKYFLSIKDYFFIKTLRGLGGTPVIIRFNGIFQYQPFISGYPNDLGKPQICALWAQGGWLPSACLAFSADDCRVCVFHGALFQGFLCKCRHGGSFSSISFFGIWIDVHELYQWKLYGYVYGKPFRKPYLEVQFQL